MPVRKILKEGQAGSYTHATQVALAPGTRLGPSTVAMKRTCL